MVSYLDMLNHEAGTAQLAWNLSGKEDIAVNFLSVVRHGRTRNNCHLYRSYGDLDNERLVLQYGFARMTNLADRCTHRVVFRRQRGVRVERRDEAERVVVHSAREAAGTGDRRQL